jgi:hypothetical protein
MFFITDSFRTGVPVLARFNFLALMPGYGAADATFGAGVRPLPGAK